MSVSGAAPFLALAMAVVSAMFAHRLVADRAIKRRGDGPVAGPPAACGTIQTTVSGTI